MSKVTTKHKFSENTLSNYSNNNERKLTSYPQKKEDDHLLNQLLCSVDEMPEFYDPYSDLNLFLAQKIKQTIHPQEKGKKWNLKVQEELVEKITPEFRQRFPQFRLGISALKKTWEKITYYSQQIEQKKEAITQEGKINIPFFIKENLKQYILLSHPLPGRSSHFAHQLATKVSECIAVLDGERPKITQLTKIIWSMQRHLLCFSDPLTHKSPYDDYDALDQLIVHTLLSHTAKDSLVHSSTLKEKVESSLLSLQELPAFPSFEQLTANVSTLLAEKLYPSLNLHIHFSKEQKQAIDHFVKRHTPLCKTASALELTRRLTALYTLATGLPKCLVESEFKSAVFALYPLASKERPELPQALYAFISAELLLIRSEEYCRAPTFVADTLWQTYQEAILLPSLEGKEDILEIIIWKHFGQMEHLLERLPYRIGARIDEEIATLLIDNPHRHFTALVQSTVQFFKKAKESLDKKDTEEISQKIHLWTMQGEMLCRYVPLEMDNQLLNHIVKKYQQLPSSLPHQTFVSQVCQEYLQIYPELAPYTAQLFLRIWTLYKYAWYTHFSSSKESSYERFLKWHLSSILDSLPSYPLSALLQKLQDIVDTTLPLVPFDLERVKEMVKNGRKGTSLNQETGYLRPVPL